LFDLCYSRLILQFPTSTLINVILYTKNVIEIEANVIYGILIITYSYLRVYNTYKRHDYLEGVNEIDYNCYSKRFTLLRFKR